MKSVYAIIKLLQETGSSKEKINILRENEDNHTLQLYLYHTYEPTISYYQKRPDVKLAASLKNTTNLFEDVTYNTFEGTMNEIVTKLSKREVTGNAAIRYLAEMYASYEHDWERELLYWMIIRNVKAGIKKNTINKVWNKLITDVPYMRCSTLAKVDISQWNYKEGVYGDLKYDGEYFDVTVHRNGDIFFRSRQGNEYSSGPFEVIVESLQDACLGYFFEKYPKEDFIAFNGEMEMLRDGNVLPREEGNGLLNSIMSSGVNDSDATPVYRCWDFVPGTAYEDRKFNMKRKDRVKMLNEGLADVGEGVTLAETTICHSQEELIALYKKYRKMGKEGVVGKTMDGIWKHGTSTDQVKVKEEKDVDLRVEGFRAANEDGKYSELIGSIIFATEDGLLEVGVSGMSEEDRKEITENQTDYIGKICAVTSNGIQEKAKGGKFSLFLPRLAKDHNDNILWRNDKDTANTLQEVKDIFESAEELEDEE